MEVCEHVDEDHRTRQMLLSGVQQGHSRKRGMRQSRKDIGAHIHAQLLQFFLFWP